MPLFLVQDTDRPMWVFAGDYGHACVKWKKRMAVENEMDNWEDVEEPQGINFICDDDEVLFYKTR